MPRTGSTRHPRVVIPGAQRRGLGGGRTVRCMSVPVAGEPVASRPYMPDYDILGPDEGTGLLPWHWARLQLTESRNYWLATVWPDGHPQLTPVWGVWLDDSPSGALWFSCGLRARKLRNLRGNPRCTVSTQDPESPVTVDGLAEVIRELPPIRRFLAASTAKYGAMMDMDFLDPDTNATVRVAPRAAFAIRHDDFAGSPTRWVFPGRT